MKKVGWFVVFNVPLLYNLGTCFVISSTRSLHLCLAELTFQTIQREKEGVSPQRTPAYLRNPFWSHADWIVQYAVVHHGLPSYGNGALSSLRDTQDPGPQWELKTFQPYPSVENQRS